MPITDLLEFYKVFKTYHERDVPLLHEKLIKFSILIFIWILDISSSASSAITITFTIIS